MSNEISGHIIKINDTESKGASGFKVRTFWLETEEKYPQTLEFEFSQEKCRTLDAFTVNEPVVVKYNVKGRVWEPNDGRPSKVYHKLKPWKMETLEHPEDKKERLARQGIEEVSQNWPADSDDIPF